MKENRSKIGKKRAKNNNEKTLLAPQQQAIQEKNPDEINEMHKAIIDEWLVNGYNRVKAAMTVKPELGYNTAKVLGASVIKDKRNKRYIDNKRADLRSAVLVDQEQVIQELVNFAYSDITDYIGMTSQQLKELPPPVRRCLSVVDIKTVTYISEVKGLVTEETIKVKLVSKERAFDMLAKHLDLFNADNVSKKPVINLTKVDKATLNVLLNAVTPIDTDDS